MDNNEFNGGQPVQPDMTGMYGQPVQPQQPDMTGMYGQPVQPQQPDVAGLFNQPVQPQQPDMTGMYGQPVQPGMGGMYPPQPPVGNGTGGKKPKKPKKPMTKGKLAAIIGGGVAAVAAVVCGVIFLPKIFKSDKEVVLDALEETFKSYGSESTLDDKIGAEDIQKAYQEKGGKSNVSYNVSVGDDTYSFDIGMNMDTAINQEKKLCAANAGITMNNAEFLSMQLYADEAKTYIAIPEIIDGYLALPNDDPMGALANSALGEMMELDAATMTGMSFNYFTAQESSSELASGYVDALETVWDAAKFEKQGRAKISVNGENVTAKEYYVTWTKEDLREACSAAIDGMTEAVTSSEDTLAQSGMSAEDFTYTMEQVKAMLPSIITSDLQVKVYVKGKRAVKITCSDTVSLMGMVSIDYDFWMDTGENDITADFGIDVAGSKVGLAYEAHDIKGNTYGSVSAYADDNKISADFTKDVEKSGDTTTTTYKVNATDYFSLELTTNTYGDDTFDCSGNLDIIGADTIVFTCAGGLKDVKKGVAYTMAIDSFDVKVANQSVCSGSMYVGVDTSDTNVAERDAGATVYEIADMTESDWDKFFEDNNENVAAWMERLENEEGLQDIIGLLGGSGEDYYEDDYDEDDYDEEDSFSDDELTLDTAVLASDSGAKYKMNGTIDGFYFMFASDSMIQFTTDAYSSLAYSITDADSPQDALDLYFSSVSDWDDYTMNDSALNQTTQVDGRDVLYSMESYVAYEWNCMDVTAVTEIEPGVYIVLTCSIYTDDDNFTVEDILQGLSSQYFEKVE